MAYDNRRYLIIPTSITGSVDFNQVHETSAETLRLSIDGTQTFVKYEVTEVTASYTESFEDPETQEITENVVEAGVYGRPSIYSEDYSEYTHSQILSILTGSEWTAPFEEDAP
jgi:hypothetical protein